MSSRLRQAYVAAKLCPVEHLTARARQSEAKAACSSGIVGNDVAVETNSDEQELVPTGAGAATTCLPSRP